MSSSQTASEAVGFSPFPPSSLHIHVRALSLLLLLLGPPVSVPHLPATPHPPSSPGSCSQVFLSINYSVEVVCTCHFHINNQIRFEYYSISGKQNLQQQGARECFSHSQIQKVEFTMKYRSQDLRPPFVLSLHPEAPQSKEEGDPPFPLLRTIHLHSRPKDLHRDR